ncbi:MAG: LTA synthase family protein [Prevotella sp.]
MRNFVRLTYPMNVLANIGILYLCYVVCRVAFVMENYHAVIPDDSLNAICNYIKGGFIFDSSAICFTNAPYLALVLFPWHRLRTKMVERIAFLLFVVTNALCIIANLCDTVYFSYTQRRVAANVFGEFQNETNLVRIFAIELFEHWYFVLLALVLVLMLVKGYCRTFQRYDCSLKKFYLVHIATFILGIVFVVFGMRGTVSFAQTRPITISNALQYVSKPVETSIILNTPFSIIKTIRNSKLPIGNYYTRHELDNIYNPVHTPTVETRINKKNVVILIVESLAEEFVGERNKSLDGGKYKGYTPFVDSLLMKSLTFENTFCNTWTSIDAMPAILASIPRMHEPFVLTPYSLDKIDGIAGLLNKWGYQTAFFHGADNGSMGFQAFAQTAGFQSYYGRTEYENDEKYGGRNDFDGTWGIWDEPFLQFFCHTLGTMKQPFMSAIFTLSSHHPFAIPDKYKSVFLDEGMYPLHKCVKYADFALRRFFETAARQPWYHNTVFVITADHASSRTTHDEYKTELGGFRVPILFFDPSGEIPVGCRKGVAQQIDIMPTVLSLLGYDKPYISFGKNLLDENNPQWAFNYNNVPQLVMDDYLLQFDGNNVVALYNYRKDRLLKRNLKNDTAIVNQMTEYMKAVLQSINERMKNDELTY